MKKLFTLLFCTASALMASAQQFDYLTFQLKDGSQASLTATGHILIQFENGNLKASSSNSEAYLAPLSNLSKMFFASTPSAVNEVAQSGNVKAHIVNGTLHVDAPTTAKVSVYSLDGRQQPTTGLAKGTYLVRIDGRTLKVIAQ